MNDCLQTFGKHLDNVIADRITEMRLRHEIAHMHVQIAIEQALTEIYTLRLHPTTVPTKAYSELAKLAANTTIDA